MRALLGQEAPDLSASTISRLKAAGEHECEQWSERDLSGTQCLQQIWMAETREQASRAFQHFVAAYEAKYDKAVVPRQGPRRPAGVLRLPGRALAALAHDEPDRECVCDGAAEDGQDAWVPEPQDRVSDGAVAGAIGPGEVAPAEWAEAAGARDRRNTIQERHSRSSTRAGSGIYGSLPSCCLPKPTGGTVVCVNISDL